LRDLTVLHALRETPWAILPGSLVTIEAIIERHSAGVRLTAEEVQAAISGAPRPSAKSSGAIAVIPIYGPITQKAGLMSDVSGGASAEGLTKQIRAAAADSTIKAIVLDVHSPGGSVYGIEELAAEIYKARQAKHITAIANAQAASAAYWLASQASDLVVTPSGEVGAIGVISMHQNSEKAREMEGVAVTFIAAGKFKGEDMHPMTDELRAAIQARVDERYGVFVRDVARGRGVSASAVRNGFGQGRMVSAVEAVKEGMADRIATLDEVLAKLGASVPSGGARAEADPVEPQAVVEPEAAPEAKTEPVPEPEPSDADARRWDRFRD
jgi:signal peptide peptidase SppA